MTFAIFWELYPRKEAKKSASMYLDRLKPEQQEKALAVITIHAKAWAAEGRQVCFIPLAGSWINGWRFDDEIVISAPEIKRMNWWQSDTLTMSHGREVGITPRPGEEMATYRQRIMDTERRSA